MGDIMGLLDRFRKNKKTTSTNNITSHTNTDDIKSTRSDFEKQTNEIHKKINNMDAGLGNTINDNIKKKINQDIDDSVIEKYGTDEEKNN